MQGQTILHPKQSAEQKTAQMNDRDFLTDALNMEKFLTDNLNVMAREASHDQLHQDIMSVLDDTHQNARGLYNLMFQRGEYAIEPAPAQKVQEVRTQSESMISEQFPQGAPAGMMN
jgi:ferritin-like metal-binding protein YciE